VRYSQAYYEDTLNEVVAEGIDWLDLGCGKRILPEWRGESEHELSRRARRLTGLDLHAPSLHENRTVTDRVLGRGGQLPFRDAAFDLLTANMVMEHVENPAEQFSEAFRVLRPGGLFVFHTPNDRAYSTRIARQVPEWAKLLAVRVLEGRDAEDVFPTHYRVNNAERITDLAVKAGFVVESIQHFATAAQTAVILPLAVIELLWIRQLTKPRFARYRHTIIARLRKPGIDDKG
jgi:ubiquinone/menaquinone biosynthesis C-methylase UbiE